MARSTPLLVVTLFLLSGVLFLDLGRIKEHDREEVGAGRRCQNPVPESLADELGEKAGMVEMDMGEEDEIERSRRDGERGPIPFQIGPLLEEAAVDEQTDAGRFDEIAGAGDLLAGAQKVDFQTLSLPGLT
jgi:hypothetical protein